MPSEEVGLSIRHTVYWRSLRRASADEADSCSEQTNLATWFHLRKEPSSGRKP